MRRPFVVLLSAAALVAPLVATSHAATARPTYKNYPVGFNSGEPSIGYDPKTDAALFTANRKTVKMTWDAKDKLTGAKDVSDPNARTSLDPIGFVDQHTGRAFTSQLVGACSLASYSDDDGATWNVSSGCGPATLLDHQTIGAGPYTPENKPATAGLTGYPDAVYYCAQNGYSGTCARSDDGGLTFPFTAPVYNNPAVTADDAPGGACSAIHGHIRVANDGVVYLPNKGCGGVATPNNLTNSEYFGGAPALVVSQDNGTTWTVRKVPGAHNQDESDPSVDFDKDNTVYFGWEDGVNPSETVYGTTSAAKVAISKDHGRTWTTPVDLSTPLGLHNVQFPEVIAGDAGRAAMSFIGTPGIGDDQHDGFVGEWHLYVATTIDGGKHWVTVDATPKDPVQRGCISLQGTSNKTVLDNAICSQRNLLDFNDITIDKAGRVLVAYSDGCVAACVTDKKSGSKGAISMVARQSTGPFLRAATVVPAKPVTKPATPPQQPQTPATPTAGGTGTLATTGGAPAVAGLALLLLTGAALVRRRRA